MLMNYRMKRQIKGLLFLLLFLLLILVVLNEIFKKKEVDTL